MQQKKQQERAYRRRRGNESLTDHERKQYRRKVLINQLTGTIAKVETIEDYLNRIEEIAKLERSAQPIDWWRRLARVLQTIPGPLDREELEIVHAHSLFTMWEPEQKRFVHIPVGETIEKTQQAILKHRRLKELKKQWAKVNNANENNKRKTFIYGS
jgi:hypothetical protein